MRKKKFVPKLNEKVATELGGIGIYRGTLKGQEKRKDPRVVVVFNGIHDVSLKRSQLRPAPAKKPETEWEKNRRIELEHRDMIRQQFKDMGVEVFGNGGIRFSLSDSLPGSVEVYVEDQKDASDVIKELVRKAYGKGLNHGEDKYRKKVRGSFDTLAEVVGLDGLLHNLRRGPRRGFPIFPMMY